MRDGGGAEAARREQASGQKGVALEGERKEGGHGGGAQPPDSGNAARTARGARSRAAPRRGGQALPPHSPQPTALPPPAARRPARPHHDHRQREPQRELVGEAPRQVDGRPVEPVGPLAQEQRPVEHDRGDRAERGVHRPGRGEVEQRGGAQRVGRGRAGACGRAGGRVRVGRGEVGGSGIGGGQEFVRRVEGPKWARSPAYSNKGLEIANRLSSPMRQ